MDAEHRSRGSLHGMRVLAYEPATNVIYEGRVVAETADTVFLRRAGILQDQIIECPVALFHFDEHFLVDRSGLRFSVRAGGVHVCDAVLLAETEHAVKMKTPTGKAWYAKRRVTLVPLDRAPRPDAPPPAA